MATIKSHTDIEQSKKLAEILPIESADMYYRDWKRMTKYIHIAHVGSADEKDLPCWSLAALLDVIKDDIKIEKTLFDQSDMFTYSIIGDCCEYRTYEHEELVDACVEMIVKLKEKDLI